MRANTWVAANRCCGKRGHVLGLESLFLTNNWSGAALYIGFEVLSHAQHGFELVLISNRCFKPLSIEIRGRACEDHAMGKIFLLLCQLGI
jgi:hypothetical protein